jgi:N-acetylmuramoyl-L-alanine amidase
LVVIYQNAKLAAMKLKLTAVFMLLLSTHIGTQNISLAQNGRNTQQQKPPFIVCIDPGHPSETAAGAVANGLSENRLNWQVALRLASKLQAMKIPYVLTKSRENEKVTNRRRAEIANGANYYRQPTAMFIRLHCDVGGGSGFAWYYPDRAATKQGVTGPPRNVQIYSRALAHTMNEAMKPVLRGSLQSNAIKTDAATGVGGKQGGVLTGSIFAKVPTALVEMCFINNRRDARFIASAQGQDKMASALAAGVVSWKRAYERDN